LKNLGGSFAHLLAEQNRYAAEPVVLPAVRRRRTLTVTGHATNGSAPDSVNVTGRRAQRTNGRVHEPSDGAAAASPSPAEAKKK
ncbi:MAG TPA: hypothetical protein VEY89_13960, partial [Candidatus Dormibacteraeota bacterium]|nr:hypothetical protein [Candidatus Dormibacteraeota bacterium]